MAKHILDYTADEVETILGEVENKQDKLPTVTNDKYLHTNASTGDLEWVDISSAGGGVSDVKLGDNSVVTNSVARLDKTLDSDISEIVYPVYAIIGYEPADITCSGTGNSDNCYATINGTKVYSSGTYTVEQGSTITFGVRGNSSFYYGEVVINGTQELKNTTTSVQTYDWILPSCSTITISFSYTTSYDRNYGRITVTSSGNPRPIYDTDPEPISNPNKVVVKDTLAKVIGESKGLVYGTCLAQLSTEAGSITVPVTWLNAPAYFKATHALIDLNVNSSPSDAITSAYSKIYQCTINGSDLTINYSAATDIEVPLQVAAW